MHGWTLRVCLINTGALWWGLRKWDGVKSHKAQLLSKSAWVMPLGVGGGVFSKYSSSLGSPENRG